MTFGEISLEILILEESIQEVWEASGTVSEMLSLRMLARWPE